MPKKSLEYEPGLKEGVLSESGGDQETRDKELSGSFQVVEAQPHAPSLMRKQSQGTRGGEALPFKCERQQPLEISFEEICNQKGLEQLANSGKQPGVLLLMRNYVVD